MRLLLFGKPRTVTHLVEDVAADLALAGHEVRVVGYRSSRLKKVLEPLLLSPRLGTPWTARILSLVRRFRPDMILAFGPFSWLPPAVFEPLAAMPGRPPLVAWIGDLFGAEAARLAAPFDAIAYTDSGMLDLHARHGFSGRALFLPLAACRAAVAPARDRAERLAFVASATPGRDALLASLDEPVALFGPDWRGRHSAARHVCVPRKVAPAELPAIYAGHVGVLNIRHELNVIHGLNQRHFAPWLLGTPVVSDAQADIARCFEPGREMLVYRAAAELAAIARRLRTDRAFAEEIGRNGRRRVMAEHLYAHRVETLARAVGVPTRPGPAAT